MSEDVDFNYWFYYDPTSPSCIRWRVGPTTKDGKATKVRAGNCAGTLSTDNKHKYGSWLVKLDYKHYCVHRVIHEIMIGKIDDGLEVDHIDGNSENNKITNLRVVTSGVNSRNQSMYSTNNSGVTGVFLILDKRDGRRCYRAACKNLNNKLRVKDFSISKYGEEGAFRLACEFRAMMIEELNKQDAGYTERHGT